MRFVLALVALFLVGATPPQKNVARDWRQVSTRTATGAHVIGNPAAKVKLVEYASYTCPHCAEFAAESGPVLKDRMIRDGSVSLEYRHLIRDGLDLAAAILARCTGPKAFPATSEAIFATQGQWLERGFEFQQANGQRIAMYPKLAQVRALADGAGLTAIVQQRGLGAAATDACFADTAEVDRILKMTADTPAGVDSTPSFFVNGKLVPHVGWAGLLPKLQAAGAR